MNDRGLNLGNLDVTTDEEKAAFKAAYLKSDGRSHPGFDFLLDNDPGAGILKRYRWMFQGALHKGAELGRSPMPVLGAIEAISCFGYYAVLGYEAGIRYMVVRLLNGGWTKAQVIEAIGISFLRAGPPGTERISDALKGLDWTPRGTPFDWATIGWASDPAAFRSGIDDSTLDVLPGEIARIEAWYKKTIGELSPYVRYLKAHTPALLKSYRVRFESLAPTLPKQLVPTSLLLLDMALGQREGVRENVLLCKAWGVSKADVLGVVSLSSVFGVGLISLVEESAGDVLRDWK